MKVIKRKLFESKSDSFSKIIFWAACTLIWNGYLRVQEILSRCQLEYDDHSTLLGEDCQLISESIDKKERTIIRILIKLPKKDRVGKDACLEVFGNDTFLCPVKAIKQYLREKAKHSLNLEHKPFFMTRDAKGYTG